MNMKIAVVLFAMTTLFQMSHGIPTHRIARQADFFTSKFKEYMGQLQGYGPSSSSSSASESGTQTSSANSETASGSETAAASDLNPSIASKEGSSSSSGVSSFQSYIPNQFSQYPSQLPSQFNPSQYNQYPSQFPSQFNPNQYMPTNAGGSAESASAAPTPAASDLQPSIAAKEGSSSSSGVSSFQSYIPNQFSQYPSQLPSQFNPSQYNQYPSQFPNQFNPNQYMPTNAGGSAESANAAPTPAASDPQPSIAAKEGSSSSSGVSSFQSYIPNQFSQYPSQLPSQFNPSQYNQYSSQFPNQFNPNQYMPTNAGGSAESASAAPTPAASDPQPSIAAKEGSSSSSGVSSFQSYIPNQFNQYPSQLPSQFNPNQYNQYPSQFPSQFNPNQYVGSGASSAATGSSTASP